MTAFWWLRAFLNPPRKVRFEQLVALYMFVNALSYYVQPSSPAFDFLAATLHTRLFSDAIGVSLVACSWLLAWQRQCSILCFLFLTSPLALYGAISMTNALTGHMTSFLPAIGLYGLWGLLQITHALVRILRDLRRE